MTRIALLGPSEIVLIALVAFLPILAVLATGFLIKKWVRKTVAAAGGDEKVASGPGIVKADQVMRAATDSARVRGWDEVEDARDARFVVAPALARRVRDLVKALRRGFADGGDLVLARAFDRLGVELLTQASTRRSPYRCEQQKEDREEAARRHRARYALCRRIGSRLASLAPASRLDRGRGVGLELGAAVRSVFSVCFSWSQRFR